MKYDLLILEFAIRNGLNPALIKAIMKWESNFRPYLVTPESKGRYSYGLMQILDQTARDVWGIYNPEILLAPRTNLYYAAKYLKSLKSRYPNSITDQIAGYNAGSAKRNLFGSYTNQWYVDNVYGYYLYYEKRLMTGLSFALAGIFGVLILKQER